MPGGAGVGGGGGDEDVWGGSAVGSTSGRDIVTLL